MVMILMLFWWVMVWIMFSGWKMCCCRKVVKFWLEVLLMISVRSV